MRPTINTIVALAVLSLTSSVYAHAVIIDAYGDSSNVHGYGLGYDSSIKRGGTWAVTSQNPFQRDCPVFKSPIVPSYPNRKVRIYISTGCRITISGINVWAKANNPKKLKDATWAQNNKWWYKKLVPETTQINVPSSITTMAKNNMIPARKELDDTAYCPKERPRRTSKFSVFHRGSKKFHWVTVTLPANLDCKGSYGGKDNICLVRCENYAIFGGCVPFQQVMPSAEVQSKPDGPDFSEGPEPEVLAEVDTTLGEIFGEEGS
ncbi:hypothetical protein H072_9931 [Dactylellina haptotyla CBS 200.50]|uniref:Uncharacterized protein n=1 Tax=Dactylellina haptotyla (strain CBS 200.50) TaxID=1284197 RepID=S8A1F6_DACHA|nr:hypothetical protein H072_9931 [Dactylellina haptotyla CBS 200.50]